MEKKVDSNFEDMAKFKSPKEILTKVHSNMGMMFFILIALIIVMGVINPRFLTINNGIIVARQASFLALIACGQMLVILTSGVDVSLGAIIGLCSVTAAIVSKQFGATAGWITPIFVGGAVGLLNGAVVAYFRIDSFAVTLGTLSICNGLALIISRGLTVYNLPPTYKTLAYTNVLTIPLPVIITMVVLLGMYIVVYRTQFGRYIYACGGNIEALRLTGVNVNRVMMWIFGVAGVLTGICAAMLSSRINSGQPHLGGALMMESIAACVVGGVTFKGGVGNLGGVVIGVLFLACLSNGFDLIGVSAFVKQVVVGSIIILAVIVDKLKK
ncbi:MAG: ABC transporter permease [Desulfobacterales bacterium]|nr:ABC transporter permease [Desulfobacterales bacterium]